MTDDSAECKKMIANCLKLMFGKLSKPDLDTLFEIIILWLEDKKVKYVQFSLFYFSLTHYFNHRSVLSK